MEPLISDEARSWVGSEWEPREYTVTREDLQKYAFSTREANPIHYDPEAARRAGYRDVVAAPCYYQVMRIGLYNLLPLDAYREDGMAPGYDEFPPIEFDRVLGAETEVEFHDDIVAGDVVTMRRRVADMWEKEGRSGRLAFVKFEYTFTNQDDALVRVLRFTRVLIQERSK